MVVLSEVHRVNATLRTTLPSPIALFVGATAGIGLSSVRALLLHTASPKIYLVGRSASSFASKLKELQGLNRAATITFIEAQVSLLRDVARVCGKIRETESSLDLLILSAGFLSLAGREETSEGLTTHTAVVFYSRMLFVKEMLPLLKASQAPNGGHVVSVLAAGNEGAIKVDDIGLKQDANFSMLGSAVQTSTLTSLAMREVAIQETSVAFVHMYPGIVSTPAYVGLFASLKGILAPLGWLAQWTLVPILNFFAVAPDDVGERVLYEATCARFLPGKGSEDGLWRLSDVSEEAPKVKVLTDYEVDGTGAAVWRHANETYDKILSG